MDDSEAPVVFDTSIFLQATISRRGPASRALRLFEQGAFRLYVSDELIDELRDVLTRLAVRRKNPHYTDADIESLLRTLDEKAMRVSALASHFAYERDPKDEHILNLAIEVGARYLVTRDKDLLDLMDESKVEGRDFQARFPALTILDPVAFLHQMRSSSSDPAD